MRSGLTIAIVFGAVVLTALTGCSDHHPAPLARLELVSRFFDSVKNKRFDEAATQWRKIYAMDKNNTFLLALITIHESNVFLEHAQRTLDSGDVDGTLRILDEGSRRYPENRTLRAYHTQVIQLRNAKNLIETMKNAKGEASMSAALTAAETGLIKNMTPQLAEYFKRYEAEIKKAEKRAEKEEKRLEAETVKFIPPEEPKIKLPPSRSAKKVPPATNTTGVPESLDRPRPIKAPESETKE